MAVQEAISPDAPKRSAGIAMLNDQRIRGILFQIVMVIAIFTFVYWIVQNTITNLEQQNISSGYGFLGTTAGFGVVDTPGVSVMNYTETSSYGTALMVGVINTVFIAILGIIMATIIGFIAGVARLSNNWIISRLAYIYVEVVRNIPLLLQIFIWYFGIVLGLLPQVRDSINLGFFGILNNRGLFAPMPIFGGDGSIVLLSLAGGILATLFIRSWATKRQMATGEQFPTLKAGLALIVGLPIVVFLLLWLVNGVSPIGFEFPEVGRFSAKGGMRIIPELIALLLALTLYTAAFIAEIVRAGILAVSHGQTEAAHSLGIRSGPTLRLVVIPQAMRVIIPPLTSQYLNLTKNSSLAVAIAFPDLVSQGGIVLNQNGQAIEIIAIWMAVYLAISLITSAFMNWYNRRMALVER